MALSLFFSPIFLVLPVPIKTIVVLAGGFLFLGFERQEKVHVVRPAVEAHAVAPADAE